MHYDRRIHLTSEQLADLMGVSVSHIAGGIKKYGGPVALGRATVNGRQQSIYSRPDAVEWVDAQRAAGALQRPAEKVPPREVKPLHEQGVYRPSPQLAANFLRSAELYGHRFITPEGIGNNMQFAFPRERLAR